ncbi:MAG: hypothetical protein FPO08_00060 [Geobacter sp.]|nr:MAG: hypothetical protein FPO08_00060 [Geobacter sp.]
MKKSLLLPIAFASTVFIGVPALASEWVDVADGQIDVSSIRASTGGNIEFWEKCVWSYEGLQGDYPNYSHTKTLGEINCEQKLLRTKLVLVYKNDGTDFNEKSSGAGKFLPIIPESIGEQVYNFLCRKK